MIYSPKSQSIISFIISLLLLLLLLSVNQLKHLGDVLLLSFLLFKHGSSRFTYSMSPSDELSVLFLIMRAHPMPINSTPAMARKVKSYINGLGSSLT